MDIKNYHFSPFSVNDYFLMELAAIPSAFRTGFKKKLLKRKGAESQKNMALLNILDDIIENRMESVPGSAEIASMLNVSGRMLDCHKSRLIKQAREYYFKNPVPENIPVIERIRIFYSAGMIREARVLLLQKYDELEKRKLQPKDLPVAFEVYEKLTMYYLYLKDLRRFNFFLKKSSAAVKLINASHTSRKIKQELNVRHSLLVSHKTTFNRFRLKNIDIAVKILETALKRAMQDTLKLKVMLRLSMLYNVSKNYDACMKILSKGYSFAVKKKHVNDAMVFESFILVKRFTRNNRLAATALKALKKNYNKIKLNYDDINQLMDIEINYLRLLIYLNKPEADDISNDYIGRQILYSRKAEAITSWYLELSDRLSGEVTDWHTEDGNFRVSVNDDNLALFENINRQAVIKFNNLYSPNILAIIYINILEQEFWKFDKADFVLADFYLNKLERIVKVHNINISYSWIESSKIGIKIFETMLSSERETVYSKNSGALDLFIEKIKSQQQSFNISADYAKLLFISQKLKIKKFTEKTEEFGRWIKINHPEIINAVTETINSRQNRSNQGV